MSESGYDRYLRFMQRDGEGHRVIEWTDAPKSAAQGWLVINSLTEGAAGGGTRMTYVPDAPPEYYRELATFLAKTMEIKFCVAGPHIGGAKSVLCFQSESAAERKEVLGRWFERIEGEIRSCYGTGGDLGVDDTLVSELTRRLGIPHPQLGVVVGHARAKGEDHERIVENLDRILENLERGVALPIAMRGVRRQPLRLSDVITGRSVAASVEALFRHYDWDLRGKRVLVEGFGNVGAPSACYLREAGATVVGILCKRGRTFRWQLDDAGLDVPRLIDEAGDDRKLLPLAGSHESDDDAPFWQTPADVFIPAAASFTVTTGRLERLRELGVQVIACGANNPFDDRTRHTVSVQRQADEGFAVVADFIANSGMARAFSYLMDPDARVEVEAVEAAVVETVQAAMSKLFTDGSPRGLIERAFQTYVPN